MTPTLATLVAEITTLAEAGRRQSDALNRVRRLLRELESQPFSKRPLELRQIVEALRNALEGT